MIIGNDFLSHAKWSLEQNNHTEIYFRSAISRAYYSLFHESFKFLKENYRSELINKIKHMVAQKNYQDFYDIYEHEKRISELDLNYILRLGINFHNLIPTVLRSLNYDYSLEYKEHRKKRNEADYNLDININYNDAKHEVEAISNLIVLIQSL